MIRVLFASLLVVAVSASVLEYAAEFQAFKLKHGKTYKNQVEEIERFAIFKSNLEKFAIHNARYEQGLETYTLGVNQFSDMTEQEFSAMLNLQISTKPKWNFTKTFKMPEGVKAPDSIDWRTRGVVTPVKNQGKCGSCWAFSLTGSTEAAYALKTGKLLSLSEQQLVDCATDVNYGCNGGFLEDTFPYIISNGFESESSYPYEATNGTCRYDSNSVAVRVDDYVYIAKNETGLQNAVGTVGPVSVGVDASFMKSYSSGIFHFGLCNIYMTNHAVLAVGYGSENGEDYWIVKNSWGTTWGENGYIRFKRGVNECSISQDNVYPIINEI